MCSFIATSTDAFYHILIQFLCRNMVGNLISTPALICFTVAMDRWTQLRGNRLFLLWLLPIVIVLITIPILIQMWVYQPYLNVIVPLYISFPLVLICGGFFATFGASIASLFSMMSIAFATMKLSGDTSRELIVDQFLWLQILCVLMIFTAYMFVVTAAEKRLALASVEAEVAERTRELRKTLGELELAKKHSEDANSNKVAFINFPLSRDTESHPWHLQPCGLYSPGLSTRVDGSGRVK